MIKKNRSKKPTKRTMNREVCRFFNSGNCRFGNHCYNLHINSSQRESNSGHQLPQTSSWNRARRNHNNNINDIAKKSNLRANAPEFELNLRTNHHQNGRARLDQNIASTSNHAKDSVQQPSIARVGLLRAIPINSKESAPSAVNARDYSKQVCKSYKEEGLCEYAPGSCPYIHGDECELCGLAALHPLNKAQRQEHVSLCVKEHEENMNYSFNFAKSKDIQCSICFENIISSSSTKKFGILPSCNHTFCLGCITKWRKQNYSIEILHACPECRIPSEFVYPSKVWLEDAREKQDMITKYKDDCKKKHCLYFQRGKKRCPFGNKCFYLHALPDGTIKDVGPPRVRNSNNNNNHNSRSNLNAHSFLITLDLFRGFEAGSDDDSDSSFLSYLWQHRLLHSDNETDPDLYDHDDSWDDVSDSDYSFD